MRIEEMIGKTVTNIYSLVKMEVGGLDTAECFVELDDKYVIDIPFGQSDDIWLKEINPKAENIFADLSDIPVYLVNKEQKTIGEIVESKRKQRGHIFNRLYRFFIGHTPFPKEYEPYKIEYRENKLNHIKNKTIVDYIWYVDENEKGLLLLDNGYLITETTVAPHGTGLAGLNLFESLEDLAERRGSNYIKLSEEGKKGSF